MLLWWAAASAHSDTQHNHWQPKLRLSRAVGIGPICDERTASQNGNGTVFQR